MFITRTDSYVLVLLLYVDDIVLIGNSEAMLLRFVTILCEQFVMKDLGNLHYFLGIQVVRSPSGLFLAQHKYVVDLLHKFQLHTYKPLRTPFAAQTTLSLSDGEPSLYRSMVGALQYLRPYSFH